RRSSDLSVPRQCAPSFVGSRQGPGASVPREAGRREMGWGCPEPPGTVLMAAPSGLTRFIPSRRSGPHPSSRRTGLFLGLTAGEDARHKGQNVRGTRFIITVVPDQPLLDDVDLLLRRLVHHVG